MSTRTLTVAAVAMLGIALGSWLLRSPARAVPEDREPGVRAGPGTTAGDPAVLARLDRLEARVEDLARLLAELSTRREPAMPGERPVPAAEPALEPEPPDALERRGRDAIQALQAIALDPRRSTYDRALAVDGLFRIDLKNGTSGSRTPEIVDELIALLELEPDPEVRRLICFATLGVTEAAHTPVLLRTLSWDTDEAVRAQAADTLQHHLDDARVRRALELASTADSSERVRTTAAEMLARWKP